MLDQAGYESENQTAFVNLQFLAGPRAEVFATTMYNAGTATIKNFVYDSSNIIPGTAAPAGALDFPLMSASFAGFSNLDFRTFSQTVGVNFRVTGNVVVNTAVSISDLKDEQPYVYYPRGKRVSFLAGVNWVLLWRGGRLQPAPPLFQQPPSSTPRRRRACAGCRVYDVANVRIRR